MQHPGNDGAEVVPRGGKRPQGLHAAPQTEDVTANARHELEAVPVARFTCRDGRCRKSPCAAMEKGTSVDARRIGAE